MKLLIGADLVPTKSNEELFARAEAKNLVGEALLELLNSADYRIFNLEVPLTDRKEPISKQGPNLIASTKCIHGYQALGTDLLTLANNHIMDQGIQGLKSTVDMLDRVGIAHVGTGGNVVAAAQPHFFSFAGKRVGVYACAEHEFSIATPDSPGANPFDPLWSFDHVEALKERVDYVIVLYHGGKEHYRYPSPNLQRVCRRFVDKGANLVICQHSHCIGCEEKYETGTIVYGQGNFLFDYEESVFWQTSLLVAVDSDFSVTYVPLEKKSNAVRLADSEVEREIMKAFQARSEEIKEARFVAERYSAFAVENLLYYERALHGRRTLIERILNKTTGGRYERWMLDRRYSPAVLIRILNYLECEAHNELCRTSFLKRMEKGI